MASSRLAGFRVGLTPLLFHGARQRGATATRLIGRAPLLRRAPVAVYSGSPGVGGRAGRWVKRQIYTVLILGGVFTGVLVVVSGPVGSHCCLYVNIYIYNVNIC